MRLLYVIDSLAPGGAETSLVEMAPHLVEAGMDVHVLPLGSRLDLADSLELSGGVVHRREESTGRAGNVRAVLKVARSITPTLVHTTLFESDIAGRVAAMLSRLPASTSVVGDTYATSRRSEVSATRLRLARQLDRESARVASRFHAVSESLAFSAVRHLGIPSDIVDVIPRGRNPVRFPYRPSEIRVSTRDSLGIARDAPVILAVGRLEPVKGLIHLLNALPLIAPKAPGVVVLIAGKDGSAGHDLRKAAMGSPCEVRWLGHRSDVPDLLAAADVLCFPSMREGSPGTLIEALAVGCPVVATDIPPNREVLGEGAACVARLSRVADPEDLSAAILQSLGDPAASMLMAAEGRARFESMFTIDKIVPQMLEFFHRAAAGRIRGREQ